MPSNNFQEEPSLQTKPAYKVIPGSHYRDIKIEQVEPPKVATLPQRQWSYIPVVCFVATVLAFLLITSRAY